MSENLTVDLSQSSVETITSAMSLAITSGQNRDDALEELHQIKDSFNLSDEAFKELFLKLLTKDVAGSDAEGASDSIGRRASSLFRADLFIAEIEDLAPNLQITPVIVKAPVIVIDADPMTQIIVGALEVYDALAAHNSAEELHSAIAAEKGIEKINLLSSCRLGADYRFEENAQACVDRLEARFGVDLKVNEARRAIWSEPYVVSMAPRFAVRALEATIFPGMAAIKSGDRLPDSYYSFIASALESLDSLYSNSKL